MAKLTLRHDQLAKFRRLKGIKTNAEFAQKIGVHEAQVSRILTGKSHPGTRFIAGVLELFGTECFGDLFAVEPDEDAA